MLEHISTLIMPPSFVSQIKSDELELTLTWAEGAKPHQKTAAAATATRVSPPSAIFGAGDTSLTALAPAPEVKGSKPFSGFVNLTLCGLKPGQGRTGVTATLLLDNPVGRNGLSHETFVQNVSKIIFLEN